jgi:hypothetical protein
MNGPEKMIYDAVVGIEKKLTEIETRQSERHEQNKKFFTKVDNLPCDTRIEQTKSIIKSLNRLWTCLWAIVFAFIISFIKHVVSNGSN